MTKVKVLDNQKKCIVFKEVLTGNGVAKMGVFTAPSKYQNIELICKRYFKNSIIPEHQVLAAKHQVNPNNYDVMFAYNEDRNRGVLYLGYFNDGVV